MLKIKPKHVRRMLDVAHVIKRWSACPSGRQHACVLADAGKYIVSTGYNGLTAPCRHEKVCNTLCKTDMQTKCKATHAEVNAVRNLHRIPLGLIIAFVTKRPCINCEESLRAAGVARVYWEEIDHLRVVDRGTKLLCQP